MTFEPEEEPMGLPVRKWKEVKKETKTAKGPGMIRRAIRWTSIYILPWVLVFALTAHFGSQLLADFITTEFVQANTYDQPKLTK